MSGVAIVRYLLANSAPLTAVVPAERIKPSVLVEGTPFPLISITSISSTPYNQINKTSGLSMDRVQVTVEADDYLQVKEILALVRAALPYTHGAVNSINCDSLLPDTIGPDGFDNNLMSHFQSQDFIVKWSN